MFLWGVFILFSVKAALAQGPAPLVEVFCTELVYRNQNGFAVEQNAPAWEDFSRRLENRQLRPDAVDPKQVQRCVITNRPEMEEAEFLLRGKILLGTLAAQPLQSGPNPAEPVLGNVQVPGFGTVAIEKMSQGVDIETSSNPVTQRSAHFSSLWTAYLEKLRKTMTERRRQLKMEIGER